MDTPMRESEPSGPADSPAHATVSSRPSQTPAEQRARIFARFVWSGRFVDWVFAGLACLLLLAGLGGWLMMDEPFYVVVVVVFLEIFLLVLWAAIRIEHREVFRVRAMSSPTKRDRVNAIVAAERRKSESGRLMVLFFGPLWLGMLLLGFLVFSFSGPSLLEWLAGLLYTALVAAFMVWLIRTLSSRKPSARMRLLRRTQQAADSEAAEDDPPPSEDA